MGEVNLLDCTLRDGGYVNDWNFGNDNLVAIFERLVDSGVDFIEVGFLDERRKFDINRSIMPDTHSADKIFGYLNKKNATVLAMIDYGTCGIGNIAPCKDSCLDGIRVIFKKHLRSEALAFCAELKALGYKVFAQMVSITSYTDEEILDLIRLANEVKPYAVSMVDTYGLMHQSNLMHYFNLLNKHLDKSIAVGYHAHNNFQMGYANCREMLSIDIDRNLLVDGSLYGMGKSAGNAPIELIAMYMNSTFHKNYNIEQMLEAIDSSVLQFYKPATWGYNMFYYIAASNACHPSYVSYLLDKRTLSIKSVNEILAKLEGDDKLLYNKNIIEKLYLDYQNNEINDSVEKKKLSAELKDQKILIIASGASVNDNREEIAAYIYREKPVVISINFIPENIETDYVFVSNSKRYVRLATELSRKKHAIIATSNITGTGEDPFKYVFNYSALIDKTADIIDNSLIMLLKLLSIAGISEFTVAGCDGYSTQKSNYYKMDMEYDFIRDKAEYLNEYTVSFLKSNKDKFRLRFLTDSIYKKAYEEL